VKKEREILKPDQQKCLSVLPAHRKSFCLLLRRRSSRPSQLQRECKMKKEKVRRKGKEEKDQVASRAQTNKISSTYDRCKGLRSTGFIRTRDKVGPSRNSFPPKFCKSLCVMLRFSLVLVVWTVTIVQGGNVGLSG
jgi:hypothetical protein